jgi:FlaG/FlaF family flagellin (archaellin)
MSVEGKSQDLALLEGFVRAGNERSVMATARLTEAASVANCETGETEMKTFVRMGMIAAAGLAVASTEASAKCVLAGGQATMVTLDLAKFMSNAALKNSINAHGWKAHGAVRTRCDTSSVGLPHCVSRQKACG